MSRHGRPSGQRSASYETAETSGGGPPPKKKQHAPEEASWRRERAVSADGVSSRKGNEVMRKVFSFPSVQEPEGLNCQCFSENARWQNVPSRRGGDFGLRVRRLLCEWVAAKHARPLSLVISILAVSLALLFPVRASAAVKVVCVARRPMQPTYPHDVVSGVEALLAGAAHSDGAPVREYQWDFGDGTNSGRTAVGDALAIEARHVYTGAEGRVFRATLTVWDEGGVSGSDDYYVRIRPNTLRSRAYIACDFALWNLHKRMRRYEQDGVPVGYWDNGGAEHRIGITAACIQAFENLGNFPFDDPDESPYVEDVRRALNQLLLDMKEASISPQSAGNPDLNGNGIGIFCHHEQNLRHIFSSEGLAMMALVMSRDPERVAEVGGSYILGRKFVEIVQEMVEFAAFGQTDFNPEDVVVRGGWRYDSPNSGEADMACTKWPVVGMMMAEKNWGKYGVSVPSWVKSELRENFLVAAHDAETGGWRYLPNLATHVNVGMTADGITCCAWTGLPTDEPMVQSGLNYITANWGSRGQFGHLSSMYNLYAISTAMRAYGMGAIGGRDWNGEYSEHLLAKQRPDGSWSSEGYEQSWPIVTAWAVLILLEPQTPPSVVVEKPDSAQQGDVAVDYRLFDENYDECDLLVEFSIDGGTNWNGATQTGGNELSYVEGLPGGLPRTFVWDTGKDIGKTNLDNVLFRITPYDGEKGEAGEAVLGVYNDVVPFERVELNAPAANSRGVAFGDYDNDGDLDLFVANFGQENFLFRNDSGILVETGQAAGLWGKFPSNCGVWGDFNGDGAMDLYVVLAGWANRLYLNDGNGYLTDVAPQLWVNDSGGGVAAAWGDFDGDNWLDIYVANDPAFGYGTNVLYRNLREVGFLNLAGAMGVGSPFPTRAASWCDFNRDGMLDLYIANGGVKPEEKADSLFRSSGDSFLDVSGEAGLTEGGDSVAMVWADLNNDGFLDVYVVNSGSNDNVLYLNNGDGTFRDETARAGLEGPSGDRGAAVGDFDNDGDLDVFVSTSGSDRLYINRGNCTFLDVGALAGTTDAADSRGAAWADVNGDGFLDLYVANNGSRGALYLNRRTEGNWLTVRCLTDTDGDATDRDSSDDRDAIGALVELDLDGDMDFSPKAPDRLLAQLVDGGSGYMSQGQLWPHFGLGSYRGAAIRVTFPDGSIVYEGSVPANRMMVVRDIGPKGDFYVQVFTPVVSQSGQVPIGYMLFNSAEKNCEVYVEYSADGGKNWDLATMGQGGDGTSRLLSSPTGVFHRFVWNSVRDIGFANNDTVRIRIRPFDPAPGPPGETSNFSVYNNTPPLVSVETPSGVVTGDIAIRYSLADIQSDKCSIGVEYSSDGGSSWHPASMGAGGEGILNLASTPEGVRHTYVWSSIQAIGHAVRNNVKVRITPSDRALGMPAETTPFVVDNNLPPSVTVETPGSLQRGNVVLTYRLLDSESDSCSVGLRHSSDGGRTWRATSPAPGGEGTTGLRSSPGGEAHVFVWDSVKDFANEYSSAVRLMVIPRDAKEGAAGESGDFVVDNLRPPELAFSPASFSFSAREGAGAPSPQTLEVWNKGSHSLDWSVVSDAGWLVAFPSAGSSSGEKDAVTVSVDTTGLLVGTYSGNITLTATGVVGSPAKVPVGLEILPRPSSLDVSEALLSFHAREGGEAPAPQYIHVRNAGSGDMPWEARADREWIVLEPTTGVSAGDTDIVEVRVNPTGLAVGSHPGSIGIFAPGAENSPQTVVVSLDIEAAVRELVVWPAELRFVTRRGGPNPPERALRLTVYGEKEVPWQASYDAPWLSVSPSSGTNSGEETVVRVSVEKAGLFLGTHEAEVTFAAMGPPLTPRKIKITLEVVPIVVPDDFPTIQGAINEAQRLDVVSVKPGVYVENIVMKDGIEVVGSGADVTTIRAGRAGSTVAFQNVSTGTLEGFTITGGIGDFFGRESRVGGGVYCGGSVATISKCSISGNSASWGGGICADKNSVVTMRECSIYGNTAASGGGVFCYENCRVILERARLFENSAVQSAGGLCVTLGGAAVVKGCEIFRNAASWGAGVFAATSTSVQVISCTIADNSRDGIVGDPGMSLTISNTILWRNSDDLVIPAGQYVEYCDIGDGDFVGTSGNISEDPRFVSPEEECYRLLPNSPCIDAGNNSASGLLTTDIDGEPRTMAVRGEFITDIGADEHNPQTVFVLVQRVAQAGAGEVGIQFTLWNALSLPADLVAEFSVGGGPWQPATQAGGEPMTEVASSPTGVAHFFAWDALSDMRGQPAKTVRVRIRVAGEDARPGATTAPFSVFKASCLVEESGKIVIRWPSVVGKSYQVYRCDQMGADWVRVGPAQAGTGEEMSFVDETLTQEVMQRYYVVGAE